MVPYIPVRAKIFQMLPDLVENLRSLIASQYAEAGGRPRHLWTWKFHSSSQSSEASAVRRGLEGAVRAAAAARPARCVLVGMRQLGKVEGDLV